MCMARPLGLGLGLGHIIIVMAGCRSVRTERHTQRRRWPWKGRREREASLIACHWFEYPVHRQCRSRGNLVAGVDGQNVLTSCEVIPAKWDHEVVVLIASDSPKLVIRPHDILPWSCTNHLVVAFQT